jgi:hypothetical protein
VQAAVLIAEVVLGAVVDGADERVSTQEGGAQEGDGAFEGASLVILVSQCTSLRLPF